MMGEIMETIEEENKVISEQNFAKLPGMNCGKMIKLTEVVSSFLGQTLNVSGDCQKVYRNMMSSLYENESRKSKVGECFMKLERCMSYTCYGGVSSEDKLDLMSSYQNSLFDNDRCTMSEIRKANSFSHLSDAGSDDYREDVIINSLNFDEFKEDD